MSKEGTAPAQLLRLVTVNSDESKVAGATRTVTLLDPDSGRPLEGVTAVLRLISQERYREIERENREPIKTPVGKAEWKVDLDATVLQVLTEAMVSWAGVIGADGRPLPVTGGVLRALDTLNRHHLCGIARTPAEVVDAEVVAASFREPA